MFNFYPNSEFKANRLSPLQVQLVPFLFLDSEAPSPPMKALMDILSGCFAGSHPVNEANSIYITIVWRFYEQGMLWQIGPGENREEIG
jgi:hypothetical protein